MTFMNMMNRIHYIGAIYAIGTILMGITNHIHNSLSITGIGCVLDMFHLIFCSSNSSWTSVRYFQFIMHFLAIVYELMYMTMLHCYWQYTEATKNYPQKSLLKPQTILPIELGQFSGAALNPSILTSQPMQVTKPSADPITHESNATAPNSIIEIQEPRAEIISTGISAAVSKQTFPSTEPSVGALHSIAEIRQNIDTTESDVNATALSNALTDPITPIQEQYSAALDTIVEAQESIVVMEPMPISESGENASEPNAISMEPIEQYSASTIETKDEK